MAAIRLLKRLEKEQRIAAPEERHTLGRFCGFGPVALSIFPDPVSGRFKDDSWRMLGEELRGLLTNDEYESAKRTTFNAFYTSPTVIAAVYAALTRFGVPANAALLEPGCGVGNFMLHAPQDMHFVGVELDGISGRIARAIHPTHDIRIENFRDTTLPEGRIDAVVGNVPFADLKLDHKGQKLSLHDYFFAKATDALRGQGVLALVTTHYTLDKQNAGIREYLAEQADFVGAIRLPSDAFKREGTAVVTDIVFLRKRMRGDPVRHTDPDWLESSPIDIEGAKVGINRYFQNHPDKVLGTWTRKDTLYGRDDSYSLLSNGDLTEQLAQAVASLPTFPPFEASPRPSRPESFVPPPDEPHITEGSFFVRPDRVICQMEGGTAVPVVYGGTSLSAGGTMTGKRLAALIALRDQARAVLRAQNEGWPEGFRDQTRRSLNQSYDRFTAAYGPVNKTTFSETADGSVTRRMPNLVKFREDPDAMLVMSLEDYDEVTGKAAKAAIMTKDVVGSLSPITSVASAEEGLLVSLNQRGLVDLPFIAELYGKSESEIVRELGELILRDPETEAWQTSDQYLSGNVRAKLAAAKTSGAGYSRNVQALEAVQPEDVLPGDIDANLGAPWIPASDIERFAAELFKVDGGDIRIGHLKQDAVWSLEASYSAERSVAATAEYGTPRANGTWLFDLALNMKAPVIYDTIGTGEDEQRVVNQEATLAAREKQKLIKERFRLWIFSDHERTERLVRVYNDTYNNLRPRLFDGSHLDFPGMNATYKLRPHQEAAVWRGMSSGNTLLAHCVGAGKTFTMAATGMKMRQAGLFQKPMFVVPNHMLEQFSREFMQLYPNARLLVAAKDDMARDRRKMLTAKIASGVWDGIIVTHSSFERIGMSRDFQADFIREQIREYDQLLTESAGKKAERGKRNLIKTIEKQKAKRETRLQELLAEDKKDDGLVFDELGVDHVFIDEAHYFKNLETPTKMDRVAGVQTGGSERAFDLFMKCRFLGQKHPGHGVTFATGTPISNTMVELYTMQRFLDPEGMRERGIDHFDGWAATFGEVVDAMEISPDGKSLRPRSRFAKFSNLPELQQMFRAFADVQTADMLDLPTPRLEGGKATVVACPMSEEQHQLQQELVERYESLRSQKVDPRVDNALAITTDGRKLALDARMLAAGALDFAESKVNVLVGKVRAIWEQAASTRGTQLVFCDMGVQATTWNYSAYEDVTRKLIARGIPEEEIASIGEADTDGKKQALFDRVRSGQVRVLLGSTQKMGTGTNVQKRLIALHHLDAPWKPAEVEQREGRILRQGNQNEEVAIFRYVTEGSFDAYMWQALETKARFISQVMSGQTGVRKAEDIGGQELSYAEVKAIASGNPAVLTLAEADAELQRLTVLRKNHTDEQYTARLRVKQLPETIEHQTKSLADLSEDLQTATTHAEDPITIGSHRHRRERAVDALAERLERLPETVLERSKLALGVYRGLRFGVFLHPEFPPEVYLEGVTMQRLMLSKDHHGPRAVWNGVERLGTCYQGHIERLSQERAIAEGQLRDHRAIVGKTFPQETYFVALSELRDKLKMALSRPAFQAEGDNRDVTVALVEQITALKSQNTVKGSVERGPIKTQRGEEPIAQRIRRMRESEASAGEKTEEAEPGRPEDFATRNGSQSGNPEGWKR